MRKFNPVRFLGFLSIAWFIAIFPSQLRGQELHGQATQPLPIMPLPAHATLGQGQFPINGKFGIAFKGYTEPRLARAQQRFLGTLSRETGIPLWQEAQYNQANFIVTTGHASDAVQQLGEDESYHLEVSPTQVRLTAANPLGVLHGLQTFLQLVRITPQGFSAPAVTIDDAPRFPWRGLMIDVSRRFVPLPVIERNLDGMEAVKLNVFHWHLSDNQGFRVESKKFPLLQEKGSDGLYYTQDQVRQVVQYARDRGIRVVPEFDMPCHTTSWFVGYPQLASGKGPYQIARQTGVLDPAMDPTKESTYKFIDEFIGEMAGLFPDAYFHVGGDECNGKEWDANPRIQRFMRAHGMANNAALQAYFTARVQKLVARHHKIMVGWDEVLQPGTPKNVVIQSWRGQASLAQAAKQGNRGLLSHGYYVNRNWPAAQYYLVDPMADDASLTPEQKKRILGGEAAQWTECVSSENIDIRTWPQTGAIAERLWSPQSVRDVNSMYRRLNILSMKLEAYGINPRATTEEMLERMSGSPDPESLRVLADVVQPRAEACAGGEGNILTPLNRLVDAVPADSVAARKFEMLAKRIASGNATAGDWQIAEEQLKRWRDNDTHLHPLLEQSSLTEELAPLSQNLSQSAEIGLEVLGDLKNGRTMTADRQTQLLQTLKNLEQPQTGLRDMIAPSVEILVRAIPKQ